MSLGENVEEVDFLSWIVSFETITTTERYLEAFLYSTNAIEA